MHFFRHLFSLQDWIWRSQWKKRFDNWWFYQYWKWNVSTKLSKWNEIFYQKIKRYSSFRLSWLYYHLVWQLCCYHSRWSHSKTSTSTGIERVSQQVCRVCRQLFVPKTFWPDIWMILHSCAISKSIKSIHKTASPSIGQVHKASNLNRFDFDTF